MNKCTQCGHLLEEGVNRFDSTTDICVPCLDEIAPFCHYGPWSIRAKQKLTNSEGDPEKIKAACAGSIPEKVKKNYVARTPEKRKAENAARTPDKRKAENAARTPDKIRAANAARTPDKRKAENAARTPDKRKAENAARTSDKIRAANAARTPDKRKAENAARTPDKIRAANARRTADKNAAVTCRTGINGDADRFQNAFEKELSFVTCGCCGIEESVSKMSHWSKVKEDKNHYDFEHMKSRRKVLETSMNWVPRGATANGNVLFTDQIRAFQNQIVSHFDEYGILFGAKFICHSCLKPLKVTRPVRKGLNQASDGSLLEDFGFMDYRNEEVAVNTETPNEDDDDMTCCEFIDGIDIDVFANAEVKAVSDTGIELDDDNDENHWIDVVEDIADPIPLINHRQDDVENENDADAVSDSDENEYARFDTDVGEEKDDDAPDNFDEVCSTKINKFAFINGTFRGFIKKLPDELNSLNPIEMSMISLINVISKISYKSGKYGSSIERTFSVLNPIPSIAKQLPRTAEESFAYLRGYGKPVNNKGEPTFHKYRPYYIKKALDWLQANNWHYAQVELKFPDCWNDDPEQEIDVNEDEIPNVDARYIIDPEIEPDEEQADTGCSTNRGARTGGDEDIFFMDNVNIQSTQEEIEMHLGRRVYNREKTECVHPYKTPFFWEKAFPLLYPYGFGYLPRCRVPPAQYVKYALMLGGDRGFQKEPKYYFSQYSYLMQRSVGGVAMIAGERYEAKKKRKLENGEFVSSEFTLTVKDMLNLTNNGAMNHDQFNKIAAALTPYGSSMPGSTMHIAQERKNALSMLTSPVVTTRGDFTWFVTGSMADTFNNMIFSILQRKDDISIDDQLREDLYDYIEEYGFARDAGKKLTKAERLKILRDHPALVSRSFHIHQQLFWKYVMNGEDGPLKAQITDYFKRIEFQLRGTPHIHMLIAVSLWNIKIQDASEPSGFKSISLKPGDIESEDPDTKLLVERYANEVITAILEPRLPSNNDLQEIREMFRNDYDVVEEEESGHFSFDVNRSEIMLRLLNYQTPDDFKEEYNGYDDELSSDIDIRNEQVNTEKKLTFVKHRDDFFKDEVDPRRETFFDFKKHDFRTVVPNAKKFKVPVRFKDLKVQNLYRKLQLSSYMHKCCPTCFKYNWDKKRGPCRFYFPRRKNTFRLNSSTIFKGRDRKKRPMVRLIPACNNQNVQTCPVSPLYMIAQGSNTDLSYIANKRGAAEYVACYNTKQEAPDTTIVSKMLQKYYASKLLKETDLTQKDHYRGIANALIASTSVGACHAMWYLLQLPFVQKSRSIIHINASPKKDVDCSVITNKRKLSRMDEDDSALNIGPKSQIGRRNAYLNLMRQQNRLSPDRRCLITYFVFCTNYSCHTAYTKKEKELQEPSIIEYNGETCFLDANLPESTKKFRIDDIVYRRFKVGKEVIVNMCPFYSADLQCEHYSFCTLLLHKPWGINGESDLLLGYDDAVDACTSCLKNNQFPKYVEPMLTKIKTSQDHLANTGNNDVGDDLTDDESVREECNDAYQEFEDFVEDGLDIEDYNDDISAVDDIDSDSRQTSALSGASVISELNRPQCRSINETDHAKFVTFIHDMQEVHLKHMEKDQIQPGDLNDQTCSSNDIIRCGRKIVKYDNHDELVKEYKKEKEKVNDNGELFWNEEQLRCIDNVEAALSIGRCEDPNKQLLMVLSGEGGTGKSELIRMMRLQAKIKVGKTHGLYGAFVVLGPTGNSASANGGFTWQSALGKGKNKNSMKMSSANARNIAGRFWGTELIVIDEDSMLSLRNICEIDKGLTEARKAMSYKTEEERLLYKALSLLPFGGFHIIFTGDFYQLPPVQGFPIYSGNTSKFDSMDILGKHLWHKLNICVELKKNNRFQPNDQTTQARFLKGARVGNIDLNLMMELNRDNVAISNDQARQFAPENALYLAPTKKIVEQQNKVAFERLNDGINLRFRSCAFHCSADDEINCDRTVGISDEISQRLHRHPSKDIAKNDLQFIVGQRVRVTQNLGTQIKIFNGALGTIISFGFKTAVEKLTLNYLASSKPAHIVAKSKREYPIIFVQMDDVQIDPETNKPLSCFADVPNVVPFWLKRGDNTIRLTKDGQKFARYQYCLEPANASTIHKAQGITARNGVVADLSQYARWPAAYVALSRPRHTDFDENGKSHLVLLDPLQVKMFTIDPVTKSYIEMEYNRLNSLPSEFRIE